MTSSATSGCAKTRWPPLPLTSRKPSASTRRTRSSKLTPPTLAAPSWQVAIVWGMTAAAVKPPFANASPAEIRAALLPEEQPNFDREYRRALEVAGETLTLDELHKRWSAGGASPGAHRRTPRRTAGRWPTPSTRCEPVSFPPAACREASSRRTLAYRGVVRDRGLPRRSGANSSPACGSTDRLGRGDDHASSLHGTVLLSTGTTRRASSLGCDRPMNADIGGVSHSSNVGLARCGRAVTAVGLAEN